MIKDRLKEFKSIQNPSELEESEIQIDLQVEPTPVDTFLKDVDDITNRINVLNGLVNDVKRLQEQICVSSSVDNNLRDELDERMNQVKLNAQTIRQKLKEMNVFIDAEQTKTNGLTIDLKIKKTQNTYLNKEFSNAMINYNKTLADYRDNCKKRIQRQLEITGREADDQEIEEMIDSKNPQIFTQGILDETKLAKQALADIQARHNDIIKLEKDILQLHEMFSEFAELVDTQGEIVDRVEQNMGETVVKVEQSKQDTKSAVENAQKVRKKKLIVGLIAAAIIVIIVILLIILLSVYIPKR